MKKIGNKINYFLKVFLAVGLLFTNVSSLSVVFAYEGDDVAPESEKVNENVVAQEQTQDLGEAQDEEEKEKEVVPAEENKDEVQGELENNEEQSEEKETVNEENLEGETSGDEDVTSGAEEQTEVTEPGEETSTSEETEEPLEEYDYTTMLNQSAKSLGLSSYLFKEVQGEKRLYVVTGVNDSEVKDIVDNAFDDVNCEIVEDQVILTRGEEEVTYVVSVYNDDYLLELVKAAVGNEEATVQDGDVNGDGKVDAEDAVILNKILKDGFDDYEVEKEDTKIDSRLDVYFNDEEIEGELNVSTGDTFEVDYVVSLTREAIDTVTGSIKYNKDLLSLEKVEARNLTTGEVYEGKYLYLGDYISGAEKQNDDGTIEYKTLNYVILTMTFKAKTAGSDTISIEDLGYYYETMYYEGNNGNDVVVVVLSSDNSLESLSIAGQDIELQDGVYEYEITVDKDVTSADVVANIASDSGAQITSIVAPEELAEGENEVTITVMAEDGTVSTYTIKVIRGEVKEDTEEPETEEPVVSPISYQEDTHDNTEPEIIDNGGKKDDDKKSDQEDNKEEKQDDNKLSRVIIVVLILLALAGLIYLIFKDDDDETKKANRDINKLKKDDDLKEKPNNGNRNRKVDKNNKKGR